MKLYKLAIALSVLLCSISLHAQMQLPKLIGDGMILQRDHVVKLWGWAKQQERVALEFKGKHYETTADINGRWQIQLPPQSAGGPYSMVFQASNRIEIKNILFGDVWICGGQSNMELPMERVQDKYPEVMATVNNDKIRQFEVPDRYDFIAPDTDLQNGKWQPATKENIRSFSAVAYFFANDLYERYKVPIGLINTALGGSPAQAWLSEDALKQYPDYYNEALKFRDKNLIRQIDSSDNKRSNDWYALLNQTDEGLKNNWYSPITDDSKWNEMNIPGYWKDGIIGDVNGSVWFRKEINVPESMIGKPAKLLLGRIVDADSVFVNDVFVGNTTYLYPPRRYMLHASVLKKGKNEIVIRVMNTSGNGGFVLDKPYCIIVGKDTVDLKGAWKYKLGARMQPLPGQTFVRWKPLGLYNGMIAPVTNYAVEGFIWYQGEANVSKPDEYTSLMQSLIKDWRSKWNDDKLPFLSVQLANFLETQKQPSESNWAALRQAQLNTLTAPNTGVAVAIDLGEWNDIHPLNKKEVGHRLALQAEKIAYNDKSIVASGPIPVQLSTEGNKLIVQFKNTGSGLMASDNLSLRCFAVAGEDGKYVWANATIKNNTVVVWNDNVKHPFRVRYAWADNPGTVNFYNKEGLPATPFEMKLD